MRETKNLPKTFQASKLSLEQDLRKFWGSRNEYKEESTVAQKVETKENLGLLYILLTEYLSQVEHQVLAIGEKLLDKMGNESKLLFPEYGKRLILDHEASWLFIQDMDKDDWYEFDMKSNANSIKAKKEKQNESNKQDI